VENKDVSAQLKAEIDGAEITHKQRNQLQQKFGLSQPLLTETEMSWVMTEAYGGDL
jgi:hypothetical protein